MNSYTMARWNRHPARSVAMAVITILALSCGGPVILVAGEPPPEAIKTVGIGHNRELLVNGKPFFPLSSWAQALRTHAKLRSMGFNVATGGGKSAQELCDKAQEAGLYAMAHFDASVKDHPALLLFTQRDEPDMNIHKGTPTVAAEEVANFYKKSKAAADTRPMFLNFTAAFMKDNEAFFGATAEATKQAYYSVATQGGDVLGFDIYPIYQRNRDDRLIWVADGVSELLAYAGKTKPVFACIETCKGSKWITYEKQKDVKPEHTRAEVWMAIIRGATGIIYFTHAWRPDFKEFAPADAMQQELKRTNEQITRLAPVILSAPAKTPVSIQLKNGAEKLQAECMARALDGSLYLFANNLDMKDFGERNDKELATYRGGEATIQVAGLKAGTKVEVVDEGRTIVAGDGSFTDAFAPLAVHIYRIVGL